jgi:phosphonate transport system ATP-binding protein
MAEPVYRLQDLGVRYPGAGPETPPVLRDFSLTIERGEQVALIGPSGAGKSTLLQVLALARQPSAGTIEAFGHNVWDLAAAERHRLRARLFLAPQVPPLPPRQRVVTAVLAGRLPHWSLTKAISSLLRPSEVPRAYEALERFDLGDKLWTRVDRLSGGERQRVSMARMMVADSEVMLVDEPLSALDPRLAGQTLERIQREAAHRNATLITSLHQVALAHAEFPRVIGLRFGRVQFDLPRAEVTPELLRELYAGAAESASPQPIGLPSNAPPVRSVGCG